MISPLNGPEVAEARQGSVHPTWTARDAAIVALALLVLVLMRLHAYSSPFETDECNYAYIGERLVQGDRLYVGVWDHQPPGMFMLTAALSATVGDRPVVFRIASTLAAAATLVAIFALCRRSLRPAGCWSAALLFALLSSDPGVAGEGWNREVFMNLLAVVAVFEAVRGGRFNLLVCGLALGVASLFKTVAAAQWLLIAVAVGVAEAMACKRGRVIAVLRAVGLLAVGPALLWLATIAYFYVTDRLGVFVDAVFTYNLSYGHVDAPWIEKLAGFFVGRSGFRTDVFRSAAGIWVTGVLGLFAVPWRRQRRFATLIAGYFAGSFLAVCLPGRFWHHYYMLMLPGLVLGTAALIDTLPIPAGMQCVAVREHVPRQRAWVAVILTVALVASTAADQVGYYLALPPDRIAWHRYRNRMPWARDHGYRIRQVTEPSDTIYTASIDTGFYYYSQRRCATRYTLVTQLTGDNAAARDRRQLLLADLQRNRPRLIFLPRGAPMLEELDRFIRETGYVLSGQDAQGMVVICDPERPIRDFGWDQPESDVGD